MSKTIDYYLFLLSPWSYIGTHRFNEVVKKHALTVNYKPISVMDTFEKMGGTPPMKRHPARQRFRLDELKRWTDYLNIPINLHPAHWPTDQTLAAQMVLAAGQLNMNAGRLTDALLAAVWKEERNISDEARLIEIANECGLDTDSLLDKAKSEPMRQLYRDTTQEAHDRDVFGSPTFIFQGENYWGQDRIDFLDRALEAANTVG